MQEWQVVLKVAVTMVTEVEEGIPGGITRTGGEDLTAARSWDGDVSI